MEISDFESGWGRPMEYPIKRKLTRLPLEVFVRVRVSGSTWVDFAETRNVSAGGMYFLTDARLCEGQDLECVLVLPERLTQAPTPVLVGCRGQVLRVDSDIPNNKQGVAVAIRSYDFSWQESRADTAKSTTN